MDKLNEFSNRISLPGVVGFSVFVAILSCAYPIAMLAVGGKYNNRCHLEPRIATWLIVYGVFLILFIFMATVCTIALFAKKSKTLSKVALGILTLLGLFCIAWFIAGNVWVFSNYQQITYDSLSPLFCEPMLYLFSFWTILIHYIIIAFICVFLLIGAVALVILRSFRD